MYQFNWTPVCQNFNLLLEGRLLGIGMALVSLLPGSVLGLVGAFARLYAHRHIRRLVAAYGELIRNVPLLLIYFLYFGLPLAGIRVLDNLASFVLALTLYSAAYLIEVFRAGLEAVPYGYIEAGKAIGLNRWQIARYITIPLMFRIVLPSPGNTFISLFKDTSLASAISIHELIYGAIRINVNTWRVIEVYINYGISRFGQRLAKRYAYP